MRKIETELVIDASIADAWGLLTDFPSYSSWNPFITNIWQDPKNEKKLTVHLTFKNGHVIKFKPKIKDFVAPNFLSWRGKLAGIPGLFSGEHYFRLIRISETQTKLEHGEIFSGLLVKLFWKWIAPDTRENFNKMNKAFAAKLAA